MPTIPPDNLLTISETDIHSVVFWNGATPPRISPLDSKMLTRKDVEVLVKAWRNQNGKPQIPKGDKWLPERASQLGPNLSGLNFSERTWHGLDAAGGIFSFSDFRSSDLKDSNFIGAWMYGANLSDARFRGANLSGAVFFEADLRRAELFQANLSGASFRGSWLEGTRFIGSNLDGVYFHRARLNNTELMAHQLGGSIGEERAKHYDWAIEAYSRLKANFESIGRYSDAGWAYRKERRMRKAYSRLQAETFWKNKKYTKSINLWRSWLGDWIVELLCDYGENPWRVLAWLAILLLVVGPSIISILGGLLWPEASLRQYFNFPTNWQRWGYAYLQHLLYTLDAITTSSYSNLQPRTDALKVASNLITMAGIFLIGLLGFVAGNRIRNS